jgi:peptidoglycan hydrolase-like protein with peptidoglycan-binding domain
MSRSLWAAAAGAIAFALTPGVALAAHGSVGGQSDRADARHHHQPVIPRREADAGRGALLVPGSGYDRLAGSVPVRSLQRRLALLGLAPGPIDGRYGPQTRTAVERFQSAAGLTLDGIAGPHTLAALGRTRRAVLAPGAGYAQPTGSKRVRSLQRRLRRLGFAPGPVDGRYGPLTMQAIRRFQQTHHLPASGVLSPRTLVALTSGRRPTTERHTRPRPVTRPVVIRPVTRHPRPETPLPVVPVLLALAALGLAALAHSYWRTRRRLQRTPTSPQRPVQAPQVTSGSPARGTLASPPTDRSDRPMGPMADRLSLDETGRPSSRAPSTPPWKASTDSRQASSRFKRRAYLVKRRGGAR